jgi:hypothetical protein
MSSTGRGKKSGGTRDFYVTPKWCIQLLAYSILRLGKHSDKIFNSIVDIGAGDGRIGLVVKDYIEKRCEYQDDESLSLTMIDIVKPGVMFSIDKKNGRYIEADFLGSRVQRDIKKMVGFGNEKILFVSNPPFSLSLKIISNVVMWLEGCAKGSEAWFLLPLNWLGTLKRADFLSKHSPSRICTLAPRPSFSGDGKTDSTEYCWMQWRQKGVAPPRRCVEILIGPTKRKKS